MQENSTNLSTFQAEEKTRHKTVAHQSPLSCVHILRKEIMQGPERGLNKYESAESASILKASKSKGIENSTGTHRMLLFSSAIYLKKLSVSYNLALS